MKISCESRNRAMNADSDEYAVNGYTVITSRGYPGIMEQKNKTTRSSAREM